jgi:L-rhamnose mutarotase
MQRSAFIMQLKKGNEEEYRQRHERIWPELRDLLVSTGISDYSIYLDEASGKLFATMKFADEQSLARLPQNAVMQRWWAHMEDIMETCPDHSPVAVPLKEVFYLP